ncbi:ankyrin repeat protein [Acanthamoeba polyphaga moumouvirus]|uniref:Ankyrin repeat protein n=1 Tax=Acanthamoeba polyphaga moumouvirus TaxID=1269028 RepID=L7RD70_9VIRU|nr:ankyrin repeat protein [Acanthamoeba polyphaga moumouvirus]AGC02226.1 ankyrin repeat protein [Acanthamoeba polyphaga moumouvirus]
MHVSNKELKQIFKDNDVEKIEEILSSKISEQDSICIIYWTLEYKNVDFHQVIVNAILNGYLTINEKSLKLFRNYLGKKLLNKLIESDCLTSEQYFHLLVIIIERCITAGQEKYEIKKVKEILKKDIDLNYNNGILFKTACEYRDPIILELILDSGFEVVYHNKYFIEGVRYLICYRKVNHLKILLKKGIDLSFINNIKIEVQEKNRDLINILVDSGVELENIIKLVIVK